MCESTEREPGVTVVFFSPLLWKGKANCSSLEEQIFVTTVFHCVYVVKWYVDPFGYMVVYMFMPLTLPEPVTTVKPLATCTPVSLHWLPSPFLDPFSHSGVKKFKAGLLWAERWCTLPDLSLTTLWSVRSNLYHQNATTKANDWWWKVCCVSLMGVWVLLLSKEKWVLKFLS